MTDVVERPTVVGLIDCVSIFSRSGSETFAIGIGALPLQPVAGAVATRMTAVGTEVAATEPSLLRAVTRERIVLPTSTFFSTYVLSLAPLIAEQLPPFSSQRRHEYAYVIGAVPVHVPLLVVSDLPSSGVPETAGGDWFDGAA